MAEIPFKGARFRIARAMRSGYNPAAPTNLATHTLFNNSTGAEMLVVRDISIGCVTATVQFLLGVTQTILGSNLGRVSPIITTSTQFAGQHFYADTATIIPLDWVPASGTNANRWQHEFPIAVLNPGWGLAVQVQTAATQVWVGFVWEALSAADIYFAELADAL